MFPRLARPSSSAIPGQRHRAARMAELQLDRRVARRNEAIQPRGLTARRDVIQRRRSARPHSGQSSLTMCAAPHRNTAWSWGFTSRWASVLLDARPHEAVAPYESRSRSCGVEPKPPKQAARDHEHDLAVRGRVSRRWSAPQCTGWIHSSKRRHARVLQQEVAKLPKARRSCSPSCIADGIAVDAGRPHRL